MTDEPLDNVRDDLLRTDERLEEVGEEIGTLQEKLDAIEAVMNELSEEVAEALDEKRTELDLIIEEQRRSAAEIVTDLGRLEAVVGREEQQHLWDRHALSQLAEKGIEVQDLLAARDLRATRMAAYKEWLEELQHKATTLAGFGGKSK